MTDISRRHLTSERVFRSVDKAIWVNFPLLNGNLYRAHDHDFAEIVFIRSGSARHVSIYGETRLAHSDCLILTPGVWHCYRACDRLEVANCCFRPALVQRELGAVALDEALAGLLDPSPALGNGPAHLRLESGVLQESLNYLKAIERLQWREESAARIETRGHFLLLLAAIGRSLSTAERTTWQRANRWPHPVSDCVRRLENEMARAWTLSELAEAVHLDASYLVRLFHRHVGAPPLQYLARRRAERAAALLLSTAMPVNEIGAQVGWPSPAHFARRFRAHFGMSAGQFRRQRQM
jgi:AraC family L-rhamnose operon transcriptional activator RhaR